MTKKDIVQRISGELRVDQALTKKIVQRCLDSIVDAVIAEGRLELRNFGVFRVKRRAARRARNPKTNETVLVPSKRVIAFRAGRNVASRVQAAPSSTK